jgi:hypothetical protein
MSNNDEVTTFFEGLLDTIMRELEKDNNNYEVSTLNKINYLREFLSGIEELRNYHECFDLKYYMHNMNTSYYKDKEKFINNDDNYSIQTYKKYHLILTFIIL